VSIAETRVQFSTKRERRAGSHRSGLSVDCRARLRVLRMGVVGSSEPCGRLRTTGGRIRAEHPLVPTIALTCSREDHARDALSSPAEHTAAEWLIAAGLLENDPDVGRLTPPGRSGGPGTPGPPAISAAPHQSRALGHADALPGA
jgi:hypothetical protein